MDMLEQRLAKAIDRIGLKASDKRELLKSIETEIDDSATDVELQNTVNASISIPYFISFHAADSTTHADAATDKVVSISSVYKDLQDEKATPEFANYIPIDNTKLALKTTDPMQPCIVIESADDMHLGFMYLASASTYKVEFTDISAKHAAVTFAMDDSDDFIVSAATRT